mmetsp:Transcript_38807/g.85262  ORF Transcript_38807/g.85262 Transcript_38807/m.85262 type:complete len:249 (-) Transcript_38807:925-1671(-)
MWVTLRATSAERSSVWCARIASKKAEKESASACAPMRAITSNGEVKRLSGGAAPHVPSTQCLGQRVCSTTSPSGVSSWTRLKGARTTAACSPRVSNGLTRTGSGALPSASVSANEQWLSGWLSTARTIRSHWPSERSLLISGQSLAASCAGLDFLSAKVPETKSFCICVMTSARTGRGGNAPSQKRQCASSSFKQIRSPSCVSSSAKRRSSGSESERSFGCSKSLARSDAHCCRVARRSPPPESFASA